MTTNADYNLTRSLIAAFDHFNATLWGERLPPAIITAHRSTGAHGYFSPDAFTARHHDAHAHEIALNPETFDRDDRAILSTLVHEMCHHWQQCFGNPSRSAYHNRQWAAEMLRVGLQPISLDNPGKMTGQRVTHEIIAGGPFDRACAAYLATGYTLGWWSRGTTGSKTSNRNKLKYTCPTCGSNAWGKPDLSLICGDCTEEMLPDA